MSKHKGSHEEHVDETWLIPYADLLTLLLALFIVLFAASTQDEEKMAAMQQAFYNEYNGIMPDQTVGDPGVGGTFSGEQVIPAVIESGGDVLSQEHLATEPPPFEEGSGEEMSAAQAAAAAQEKFNGLVADLEEQFKSYVELNGLEPEMSLEITSDGLLITLTSDVWFASGSADINGPQKEIAAQISTMLANMEQESQTMLSVVISGHTDNIPMSHTNVYANNWQLSVARAVNFMEELMNTSSLQPSNFSARGFGEYEPIDTNETAEGRQKNRRVEVLVSPEISEPVPDQVMPTQEETADAP